MEEATKHSSADEGEGEGESGYSSSSENDELCERESSGVASAPHASQEAPPTQTPAALQGDDSVKRDSIRLTTSDAQVVIPQTGTGYPMIWPPPHHIWTCPPHPEPLNELKEGIVSLMIIHDNKRTLNPASVLNRVVYDSIEPNPASKLKTALGPGEVRQYYELTGPDDDTLIFESRFESGNLRRAIQIYPSEYDLILRPDINTRGHTQWYYFSVSNMRKGRKYKFNIINMMKPDSVYNQGLRPLAYSNKEAETKGVGWNLFHYSMLALFTF